MMTLAGPTPGGKLKVSGLFPISNEGLAAPQKAQPLKPSLAWGAGFCPGGLLVGKRLFLFEWWEFWGLDLRPFLTGLELCRWPF